MYLRVNMSRCVKIDHWLLTVFFHPAVATATDTSHSWRETWERMKRCGASNCHEWAVLVDTPLKMKNKLHTGLWGHCETWTLQYKSYWFGSQLYFFCIGKYLSSISYERESASLICNNTSICNCQWEHILDEWRKDYCGTVLGYVWREK